MANTIISFVEGLSVIIFICDDIIFCSFFHIF